MKDWMMEILNGSTCERILAALERAGVVAPAHRHTVLKILNDTIPKNATYNFKADSEFLLSLIDHHVSGYFKRVLHPLALTFHSNRKSGRMIKDEEVSSAAIELTTTVINEVGYDYKLHMCKYFGDDAGLATFVYSRIFDLLIDMAKEFNDQYLDKLNSSTRKAMRPVVPASGT